MSVSDQPFSIAYGSDGVSTVFAYPYYFRAFADLVVMFTDSLGVVTTKILSTDYNVSGALDPKLNVYSAGGNVTFLVAPVAGGRVFITRHTPRAQSATFNPEDPFPAGSMEAALDNMMLIIQETTANYQGYVDGPPTSGTFTVGDWFWINDPAAFGFSQIICTSAGPPAVWKPMNPVSA